MSLIIVIIFLLGLLAILTKIFFEMRYKLNYIVLYLITIAQGNKFKMITKHKEIKETLMLSDKGIY